MRAVIARFGAAPKGSGHPPLTEWTREVAMLAKILDQLKAQHALMVVVNSKPGTATPNVTPELRPETVIVRLEWEARLGRHHALAARLVRNGDDA